MVPLTRIKAFLKPYPRVDLRVLDGAGHLLGFRITKERVDAMAA